MSVETGVLDDTRVMDDTSRMDLPRPIDKDDVRVGDTLHGRKAFGESGPDVELKVLVILNYDFVSTGGLLINRHAYEWTLLARGVSHRPVGTRWCARDFSRWVRTGHSGSRAYICYKAGESHETGAFAAEFSRLAQELQEITTMHDA